MQRIPLFSLVLLAICAGVFAYLQHSEVADLRGQLAAITAGRDAALADAARAKASLDTATENIARLTTERNAAIDRAKGSGPAPVIPIAAEPPKIGDEGGGKTMMTGIAKMFQSDEGKKMMRAQMAIGVKMQYGSIAKDLKLDPKSADQVLALLADRQAAISEMTFATMKDGAFDDAAAKTLSAKSEALQSEYNEKLRTVLGDDGMAQLTEYERTASDRALLTMHEQQLAAVGVPLQQPQRDALVEIMKEERLKTPASAFDVNSKSDPAKAMSAMRDDAAVEKWLTQEEDYQRRVLQGATRALSPDQVNALQQSLKQQLEMQRFGVTMSKEMFKGSAGSASLPVPPAEPTSPAK